MKPYKVWVTEVPFPGHYPIVAIRLPIGSVGSSLEGARQVMGAFLLKMSLETLTYQLVVIDDGHETAHVFGPTTEAETFIRDKLSELLEWTWRQTELHW